MRHLLLICALLMGNACVNAIENTARQTASLPEPSLEKIADDVWIHKSYEHVEPWGPVLSQGMIFAHNDIFFLIDTAWDDTSTLKVIALMRENLASDDSRKIPYAAIMTHAHKDKMGGVNALHQAKIETHALHLSNDDAPARDLMPAEFSIDPARPYSIFEGGRMRFYDQNTTPDQRWLYVFHPSAGHTRDNIVIYDSRSKVLFGGCLIRPESTKGLGNTADADIANWADAVREVAAEFPQAEIIIPSHGAPGGRELLQHTIDLALAAQQKQ